jgi:class 3 adenylate cyclase/DNA-binding CsgD family transcriptional regulator
MEEHWGGDLALDARAPSLSHDPQFREWWSTYLRMSASPGAAVALGRMNSQIDIREVLPTISLPTLVLHREGDRSIRVEHGRYLAEHIPGARYVEFPGDDHIPFSYPNPERILAEIEQFLTGSPPAFSTSRTLATFLFTEIVESAALAARTNDEQWGRITAAHDQVARELFVRFRGREVKRSIAGFLATFDGPARAIECAIALTEQAKDLGLPVRAGLHTGECLFVEDDVLGVAVQIASRVVTRADPGAVVVSSTVTDLVAGSGIEFERLHQPLPFGTDRDLDLYRVVDRSPRTFAIPVPGDKPSHADEHQVPLSPREIQVAELIGHGLSNRMIADELCISIATAERHVANIFTKLGFNARSQVAVWVFEQGLLPIRPHTAQNRQLTTPR